MVKRTMYGRCSKELLETKLMYCGTFLPGTGTGCLLFLLLCLINSFFGTFEKTQLQIEHFLEHLAKWHPLLTITVLVLYDI